MEGDRELEFLKAKKLLELQRRLKAQERKEKSAREVLVSRLVDRGVEVLEAAEASYPKETALIVERLAQLIKNGSIKGYIAGGELLSLFRALGLRVSVQTTISVEEHGKFVPLAEKLKSKDD